MAEGFDLDAEVAARDEATEAAALVKLTEDTDLEWLMGTQQGRRLVWRLLSMAGVFRLSYAGADTHATAFAEGARNIGLFWLGEIQRLAPGLYGTMTKENSK